MKKIFYILIINLVLIFIFLGCLELYLYNSHKKHYPDVSYKIKKVHYNNILSLYRLSPVEGEFYTKRPILLLGCSYAYGQGLNRNQTLGFKLSNMTKRPVYNYSLPGKGLQNTLFLLENKMLDKNIKNPEYIIYVFMSDQIRRLYSTVCFHDYSGFPLYKLGKDGLMHLKKDYYPMYKQFYTYYFFNNMYYFYKYSYNLKHHSKLISAYFNSINNEIKNSGINVVDVMYNDRKDNFGLDLSSLDNSIQIVHTNDLTDVILSDIDYHISEKDFHPSEKAWDIIVPELIKKLKL